MITVERRMAEAYTAGYRAAANETGETNPHDGDARRATERVCAIAWTRGYSAGNPMPDPEG